MEAPSFGRCYEPTRQLGRAKQNKATWKACLCRENGGKDPVEMNHVKNHRFEISSQFNSKVSQVSTYVAIRTNLQVRHSHHAFGGNRNLQLLEAVLRHTDQETAFFCFVLGWGKCPNNEKHLCTSFYGGHSLQSTVSRTFSVSASKGSHGHAKHPRPENPHSALNKSG